LAKRAAPGAPKEEQRGGKAQYLAALESKVDQETKDLERERAMVRAAYNKRVRTTVSRSRQLPLASFCRHPSRGSGVRWVSSTV